MKLIQTLIQTLHQTFENFFLAPASALPLAALRIGTACVLLFQCAAMCQDVDALFGDWGIMQTKVRMASVGINTFDFETLHYLTPWLPTDTAVRAAFAILVLASLTLVLGWMTRISVVIAYAAHLLLKNHGQASAYGVSEFVHISLVYLMISPCGNALSLDSWKKSCPATSSARLALRALQIHLCIVYATSGYFKSQGIQWWNGEAIWRASNLESLNNFHNYWLADFPWIGIALSLGTLALELGFAVFIWLPKFRFFWAFSIISMHAGIALVLGLYAFSGMMIAMNIAAFILSAESRCPQSNLTTA